MGEVRDGRGPGWAGVRAPARSPQGASPVAPRRAASAMCFLPWGCAAAPISDPDGATHHALTAAAPLGGCGPAPLGRGHTRGRARGPRCPPLSRGSPGRASPSATPPGFLTLLSSIPSGARLSCRRVSENRRESALAGQGRGERSPGFSWLAESPAGCPGASLGPPSLSFLILETAAGRPCLGEDGAQRWGLGRCCHPRPLRNGGCCMGLDPVTRSQAPENPQIRGALLQGCCVSLGR